jgi:hypothetical protein
MSDCLENIEKLGPEAVPCEKVLCEETMETAAVHALCSCEDWQGNPIPNCDPKFPSYPFQTIQCVNSETGEVSLTLPSDCMRMGPPWELRECFCCCGEPPQKGGVAAPSADERPVADVQAGETIDVGRIGAGGELSWRPVPAAFAREESGLPAVGIAFGEDGATVADAGALFLQPSGLLKRADELTPGRDALVSPDGRELPVLAVRRGTLRGSLCQVAASLPSYEELDGTDDHLLARDGAVVGDYVIQLYQHSEKLAPHLVATKSDSKE